MIYHLGDCVVSRIDKARRGTVVSPLSGSGADCVNVLWDDMAGWLDSALPVPDETPTPTKIRLLALRAHLVATGVPVNVANICRATP